MDNPMFNNMRGVAVYVSIHSCVSAYKREKAVMSIRVRARIRERSGNGFAAGWRVRWRNVPARDHGRLASCAIGLARRTRTLRAASPNDNQLCLSLVDNVYTPCVHIIFYLFM